MERSTCLTSAADRELQRRSFMLTKLIEQNRVMAKQQQQQQQQQQQKQKQSASSRNADDRAALRIDIPKVGPPIHASDGGAMPRMAFRAPQPEKLPLPPTFQTKTKKTVRLADEDEDDDNDFGHLQSLREEVRRISREKEVNDTKGGKQVVLQRSFSSPGAAAATRRRTDLSTEAEVSIAALSVVLNVRVKAADMPAAMQERAFRCARKCFDSMEMLNNKRVALSLKKEFDASYGPAWHCIVGTSFGSFVTHSLGGFLYFSIDKVSILLFKTAVEPMDQ